ncbi:conserved protein of unknown function [Acidithiobacillus ferrivorans]|uniref:Uncharacterized protein n=1 Tax=Acidithiobacillus ferrivorans TaxID=160808 RepID=A0ABY1MME9_9PROT|nr:conserved protein of unknown function [Acidithiobacillus ferrivorans]
MRDHHIDSEAVENIVNDVIRHRKSRTQTQTSHDITQETAAHTRLSLHGCIPGTLLSHIGVHTTLLPHPLHLHLQLLDTLRHLLQHHPHVLLLLLQVHGQAAQIHTDLASGHIIRCHGVHPSSDLLQGLQVILGLLLQLIVLLIQH